MFSKSFLKFMAAMAAFLGFAALRADASEPKLAMGNQQLQAVLERWGAERGDKRYSPKADFVRDGRIDNADLQFVLANWNKSPREWR